MLAFIKTKEYMIKSKDTLLLTYKNKKSLMFRIIAGLIMLWSLMWINNFLIGGSILNLCCLIYIANSNGIELDLTNRKYRDVNWIGSYGIGQWSELPEIKYISVFKALMSQSLQGRSGTTVTQKNSVIQINLIHGKNKRLKVYQTEDKEEAFFKAKIISEALNLRIYDATSKDRKWMEEKLQSFKS